MATLNEWMKLADRVYAQGVDVFNAAELGLTDDGPRDPNVVALTLLARSLGNFKAVVILVDNNQIVEARVLVRCVYENLFWAGALLKQREAFVDAIEVDDRGSRKRRGSDLLQWANTQEKPPFDKEALGAFLRELDAEREKSNSIILRQAAEKGGLSDTFIVYRQLSSDSAHPSATSLSRHVSLPDDGDDPPFTLHASPNIDADEAVETLEYLCNAMIGVIIATSDTLGGVQAGEGSRNLSDEFQRLLRSGRQDPSGNSSGGQ